MAQLSKKAIAQQKIAALALSTLVVSATHAADEFSSGDKIRTLYSNHFSFTDRGIPEVTIEIMGGQHEVQLGNDRGIVVMPDGIGGAKLIGTNKWSVQLENARPATIQEWIIMSRFPANGGLDAEREVVKWKKKGHRAKTFEIGTIFAVDGKTLDTRTVLVGIDPVAPGKGLASSRQLSSQYHVNATVHRELLRKPSGTIVARSGDLEVRNASVLWFVSQQHKETIKVKNVISGAGGAQSNHTKRSDRRYFGSVYVTVGSDGKLTVGNSVAADALLNGLVPSEMFPDAPMEALKAQSIAARTELLQKLGVRHTKDPFLLCSTQHCQVYSGAGHEHSRTNKAVRSTRGQVLITPERQLVDARYSATCGGHSEHNEVVWGGEADPTLRGHVDGPHSDMFAKGITSKTLSSFLDQQTGYCGDTRYSKGRFRWAVRFTARQLSQLVAETYPGLGDIIRIMPITRGISGRITQLTLKGSGKSVVVNGELTIRRLFGGLRSSLFVVTTSGPAKHPLSFEFRGAGSGHGVGMCQVGAIGMADKKFGVDKILSHYYINSRIHRLY